MLVQSTECVSFAMPRSRWPATNDHVLSKCSTVTSGHTGVDFIAHCFATISRLNAGIVELSVREEDRDNLQPLTQKSQQRIQDLVDITFIVSIEDFSPRRADAKDASSLTSTPRPCSFLNPDFRRSE
jgi:hypothetical protein